MATPFQEFLNTSKLSTDNGDLLSNISKKSQEIFRSNLNIEDITKFSPDVLSKLKYVLLHKQPHLDEYLASLFLRSCLPENLHVEISETCIFSKDDDKEAKNLWPNAAVLGIGSTVNGGATPLLLFDEHVSAEDYNDEEASLVMLMKRAMIGSSRPSASLYKLLKEVHNIDVYGNAHSKNLASYVKILNSVPLPSAGYTYMDTKWKSATVDAITSAVLLELNDENSGLNSGRFSWQSSVISSIDYVSAYSPLALHDGFDEAKNKILDYATGKFVYSFKKTHFEMHDKQGKSLGTQNLLIPYFPALLKKHWGETIADIIMYPFWETRIYKEMMSSEMYQEICDTLNENNGEFRISTGMLKVDSVGSIKLLDFKQESSYAVPGSLNHYVNSKLSGNGISIFRNQDGTMLITKGENIEDSLWGKVCDAIVSLEGESDDENNSGSWHITRSPSGIAGFILNGNPTHQYIKKSQVTIETLKSILEKII